MGSGKGAVEYWVVGVNKAVAIAKSTKALH
jgi:ribosomal protein L16/L10AE